jgi:hypothetical protein
MGFGSSEANDAADVAMEISLERQLTLFQGRRPVPIEVTKSGSPILQF